MPSHWGWNSSSEPPWIIYSRSPPVDLCTSHTMAQHTMPPIITSSKIGIGTTFYTSWFFDKFGPKAQLPTPDEVVAIGTRANKETYGGYIQRPPPVRFSNLGILVKWGEYITPAEAVCLHTLRTEFGDQVPVPELYGWHDQPADPRRGLPRLVFIYMEEVIGHTLKERYESLQSEEEAAIAHQLGAMIAHLRTLRPCSSEPCVGELPYLNALQSLYCFLRLS